MPVRDLLFSASGAAEPSDPQFEYVTLLLDGNGTNGGQNNTFLDSSTNNFTITRNGNTTQGSFSPYGSNWGNYFDGDGDGVTSAASSGFAFGTGDFTYEGWYFSLDSGSSLRGMFDTRTTQASSTGILLREDSSQFLVYVGGTIINAGSRVANTWQHIALVRQSGTIRLYVNGIQAGTASNSTNFTDNYCRISGFIDTQASPYGYYGYISNARVIKGTCLYPNGTTFTPSTTPLTAISGTSLLTCQSNRFIDTSSNALAITVNGSPSVQRFSPFEPSAPYSTSVIGGSGYFDGSGDWLSVADDAAWTTSSAYTIECWYNPSVISASFGTLMAYSASAATAWVLYVNSNGTVLFRWYNTSVTEFNLTSSAALSVGAWNHIAVTISGTTATIWINGTSSGTLTLSGTQRVITSGQLGIGAWGAAAGSLPTANGYIANARIVKGTAVYTNNFTPPTAPLTAITNTSLLLNFTNASIADLAMQNNLETVGNAQVSTSVKKYGTGSLAFDGTGDGLFAIASPNTTFGTGNFTVEFWVYLNSTSSTPVLYDGRAANGVYPTIYLSGAVIYYFVNSANRITGSTLSTSTWYHIAVSRSGTSTKMFVNGTQSGSTYTDSNNYLSGPQRVGYDFTNGSSVNGYIDDFRITKGVARYTANFTAPTAPFPTY